MNRIDQYTPQGSITYSQSGTNADGTPKYTQTQQYSAAEQAKYDNDNAVALGLGKLATQNIDRVGQTQGQDFNFDKFGPMAGVSTAGLPFGLRAGPTAAYGTQNTVGDTGTIQKGLNYNNLTALPGTNDFSADAQRVAGSVYDQATSRLDPQWQQNESDMRSRLAAQGISENSDAYRRELDNAARAKNDAYNQANYSATQAGSAEQSRLFGLAMAARQQGQNETNAQGQFANAAQDQQYSQALGLADLYNQANAQAYGQDASSAAFNNQARNQAFNENSAVASSDNANRNQAISEASYLRNLPLNEIASLMGTAGSVQNPTFSNVAQVGVAAPDYQGIVQNNYNGAMNQYNQQMQARSSMLGSIFGSLGAGAGMIAASDERLKYDIRRVGLLRNGIPTYSFRYKGSRRRQFGVMAQEVFKVLPNAVLTLPNGMLAVDYSKVY